MIRQWITQLVSDPIYKFITIIVMIQVSMIVLAIIGLLIPYLVRQHRTTVKNKFATQLGNIFLYEIEDDAKLEEWIRRAHRYPPYILYDFINQYFYYYTQDSPLFGKILYVYEELGLLKRDVKAMGSAIWHRRIMAVRRLMYVASEREKRSFDRCRNEGEMIKILAIQILGRIGTAEELFDIIHDHKIENRLMEQPFFVLFNSLPMDKFHRLMERWTLMECPQMTRVMLICYARRDHEASKSYLLQAASSQDFEMRTAFCKAAASIPDPEVLDLLRRLSTDPAWEVRAQAARSLGMVDDGVETEEGAALTTEILRKMLEDEKFWVRQAAALALNMKGQLGRGILLDIEQTSSDQFAKDTAKQELERIKPDGYPA